MKKIGFATLLVLLIAIPLAYGQNTLAKKLNASPDDFVGKDIVLQCLFIQLSTMWLNSRVYFPSTEYLGFYIWGPDQTTILQWNFVKKKKGKILYDLKGGDRITIYGKVTSSTDGFPWIEVYEIKKGWK
ncbi:MAG: hypothetical protein ACXWMS_09310 [Syntrophales bacterium]